MDFLWYNGSNVEVHFKYNGLVEPKFSETKGMKIKFNTN